VQIGARGESGRAEGVTAEGDGGPVFHRAGTPADGEYHCAACGYGVSVRSVLPVCPMCRGREWEDPATSPFGRSQR